MSMTDADLDTDLDAAVGADVRASKATDAWTLMEGPATERAVGAGRECGAPPRAPELLGHPLHPAAVSIGLRAPGVQADTDGDGATGMELPSFYCLTSSARMAPTLPGLRSNGHPIHPVARGCRRG